MPDEQSAVDIGAEVQEKLRPLVEKYGYPMVIHALAGVISAHVPSAEAWTETSSERFPQYKLGSEKPWATFIKSYTVHLTATEDIRQLNVHRAEEYDGGT